MWDFALALLSRYPAFFTSRKGFITSRGIGSLILVDNCRYLKKLWREIKFTNEPVDFRDRTGMNSGFNVIILRV